MNIEKKIIGIEEKYMNVKRKIIGIEKKYAIPIEQLAFLTKCFAPIGGIMSYFCNNIDGVAASAVVTGAAATLERRARKHIIEAIRDGTSSLGWFDKFLYTGETSRYEHLIVVK